jgi:hypothetical protein
MATTSFRFIRLLTSRKAPALLSDLTAQSCPGRRWDGKVVTPESDPAHFETLPRYHRGELKVMTCHPTRNTRLRQILWDAIRGGCP